MSGVNTPEAEIDLDIISKRHQMIAIWLFVVAGMIFLMIVLGGYTRLTHSGLSMVEWKPATGWLPPIGDAAWMESFDKYKAFPQYQQLNYDMVLSEFKSIFWPEYLHRVWGRLIGVAFFVPFIGFLLKGWVRGPLVKKLMLMFVLGGLQGGMGWFMVKSGLVDSPDVSQYRLTAHLAFAIVLFGYILWTAFELIGIGVAATEQSRQDGRWAIGLMGLIFVTIVSGGFVAGLDAGFVYNTFPMMNGSFIAEGAFELSPFYLNFFEDVASVQFDHRILALATLAMIIAMRVWAHKNVESTKVLKAIKVLVMMGVIQVALGITTLLLVVPVSVATAHQAGAVILFGVVIWVVREMRGGR